MLSLPKSYNRHCGKILTITSVLLALLLAIAIAPSVTLAQDNGPHKLNDPTGTWLIIESFGPFQLITFNKGGTLTQDTQGESAFDPGATNPRNPPLNVITSPQHGVWQKTGGNTFAATLLAIEYEVSTDPTNFGSPLFRFDKTQYTGKLNETGDRMEISGLGTFFDQDGNQLPPTEGSSFKANGVRIPLEVLPNTSHTLPIPPAPAP
jgi:hypothetical protein